VKRFWIAAVTTVLLFGFMVAVLSVMAGGARAENQPPRPRFERIYSEDLDRGGQPRLSGDNFYRIVIYHDRETGQEIACMDMTRRDAGGSCWLTGRKWGVQ
jgi:hypothetical protein